MNDHVINVLGAFAVAYGSSVIYWLSKHRRGVWRWIAGSILVAGFIALALTLTWAGTGQSAWDWWIVLGWTCGWIAWFFTRQELGLEA